jgi:hypothetical protein
MLISACFELYIIYFPFRNLQICPWGQKNACVQRGGNYWKFVSRFFRLWLSFLFLFTSSGHF